jgi:Mlc titration factor MtfA (ptsG expression regulator)
MAAMGFLRDWRRRRLLDRHPLPEDLWAGALKELPLLDNLSAERLARLRELATLFLHEKSLEAVHGLVLTESMKIDLATQAVLPLLDLAPDWRGLDWYDGWVSVVLYPDEFASRQEWTDDAGVVHARREIRSGEAWEYGPVVLSWADVAASGSGSGYNAVIHEMAHKLDMSNGAMDGCPRLHAGMRAAEWRAAFKPAFEDFCARVERGEETALDPYAAEAPEEFFAVLSEEFFERPALLEAEYPAVHAQLAAFYRRELPAA